MRVYNSHAGVVLAVLSLAGSLNLMFDRCNEKKLLKVLMLIFLASKNLF